MRLSITPRLILPISPALVSLVLTGCVSSAYQSAPRDTRPQKILNLTLAKTPTNANTSGSVEVTLHSVIAFHGPGSWKSEAYWDEYVLTIANRGATTASVSEAALVDFHGSTGSPGDNPWNLETQSRQQVADITNASGEILEIGNGAEAPDDVLGTLGQAAGGYAGLAAVGMAATATPIGLPIYAVSAVFLNQSRKHHIEEEFGRRRLQLPLTLAPGASVQGSLFFRISPGPRRLALRGRIGAETHELVIDLAPLKGLHLKSTRASGR